MMLTTFIKLTTSDAPTLPIYINAHEIAAMYRNKDDKYTMVHYRSLLAAGAWAVKETPDQIMQLMGVSANELL